MLRLCLALLVFSAAAEGCQYDVHESLDGDTSGVFAGTEGDGDVKAVGAGSVVFDANGDGGEYKVKPRQYTNISFYMAFGDTDSLPTFSLSGGEGRATAAVVGWAVSLKPTGLDLTGNSTYHIPMVLAIKKFYFFEFLIDYATGTMTLRMDGEVKSARNAPQHPESLDDIDYVTFEGQGWLDELRLEGSCTARYAVTGTLGSAVHNELVAGGLVLTITRSSGAWVDTEATKQALIDGLVADSSSRALTGWNALKSTMMSTASVTISGSSMTLGPLYRAAAFYERAPTLVTLKVTDIILPTEEYVADDWYFVIPSSPSSGVGISTRVYSDSIPFEDYPDFASMTPKFGPVFQTGVVDLAFSDIYYHGGAGSRFASQHTGYLTVTTAGNHSFTLEDGTNSRLFISGEQIIAGGGVGAVVLPIGKHEVRIEYYFSVDQKSLKWLWQQPGEDAMVLVPKERLSPLACVTVVDRLCKDETS
ncbi:hypothetical protein DIPPA_01097 [Diplonema papillatum]|nr:hypothetical protein DIPPA_01064 [Diplonema papillatum]KAJ9466295.1 hypothetical protein DIPPA_01097 [Diplonema papillatum]